MKVLVKDVQTRTDTTNKGNQVVKQLVALDLGSSFPQPFWVTIQPGREYQPGEYTFGEGTFRPGRYGGIEIDPYNVALVPLQLHEVKKAS